MELLDIIAVLFALAAVFGFFNVRFLKLPSTIGLTVITLACSIALLLFELGWNHLDLAFPGLGLEALGLVEAVAGSVGELDFSETLLHGMLCFLLFAGALHVNLGDLLERKWAIGTLATVGVALSTAVVGGLSYVLFLALDLDVPLIYCLVFGALISPTDPVAVLGVLKNANAPRSLEAKIAGESLFNDGVGIVFFIVITAIAIPGRHHVDGAGDVIILFLREAAGGAILGLVIGYAAYRVLKTIDHYQVELIITIALVLAANSIAMHLHVSGPIAVVVAGLFIGNQGKRFAMSDKTVEELEKFWTFIDDILNALLFLLIGLEFFAISFKGPFLAAGLLAIPLVLAARFVSVGVPITLLKAARRSFTPRVIRILTWCGLRGGISVALILSLPRFEHKSLLITCTYMVVVFSVIVQGLTVKRLVRGLEETA